jgi:hypothetical protein
MRLMKAMIGVIVLSTLAFSLAPACDGDNNTSEEPSDQVSPQATQPAEATEQNEEQPHFVGGSASATVDVAGRTLAFEGGDCGFGTDNQHLDMYIDEVLGKKYFGLTAGDNPALEHPRSAQGGGEFVEGEFFVWWATEGSPSSLREGTLTLASDLASGEFEGTDEGGEKVTGSFACN